jgi:hypothetical protein
MKTNPVSRRAFLKTAAASTGALAMAVDAFRQNKTLLWDAEHEKVIA